MSTLLGRLASAARAALPAARGHVIKIDPSVVATPEPKKPGPFSWTFNPSSPFSLPASDPRSAFYLSPSRLWDDPPKMKAWRKKTGIAAGWDMWDERRSAGGNPLMEFRVGRLNAHISWGPTRDHVRPGDWGPKMKWYADLEVEGGGTDLPTAQGGLVGHIERGFPTRELAEEAVRWLRSCVEEAGLAGLLALNARSGGRHA